MSKLNTECFNMLRGLYSLSSPNIRSVSISEMMPEVKTLKINKTQIEKLDDDFFLNLPELETVELIENKLTELPRSLFKLSKLIYLDASNNSIKEIPDDIENLKSIKLIKLGKNQIQRLPNGFCTLENLQWLDLEHNKLTELPVNFADLEKLRVLYLHFNRIKKIPPGFFDMKRLKRLNISENLISELPDTIKNPQNLECLALRCNPIQHIPSWIFHLSNLKHLDLQCTNLRELPKTIGNIRFLELLYLEGNLLTSLPDEICSLGLITTLTLDNNFIEVLPENFGYLRNLEELSLAGNRFKSLPKSFSLLRNIKRLHLDGNMFDELPSSVCNLRSLRILSFSSMKLSKLPDNFHKLYNLDTLCMDDNKFKTFPNPIIGLRNLKTMSMDKNELSELPQSVVFLSRLTELNINSNKLKGLPEGIGLCEDLKIIRAQGNNIESLPDSIGNLKNLILLDLNYNKLKYINKSIDKISGSLKILDLRNNLLQMKGIPGESFGIEDLRRFKIPSLQYDPQRKFSDLISVEEVYRQLESAKISWNLQELANIKVLKIEEYPMSDEDALCIWVTELKDHCCIFLSELTDDFPANLGNEMDQKEDDFEGTWLYSAHLNIQSLLDGVPIKDVTQNQFARKNMLKFLIVKLMKDLEQAKGDPGKLYEAKLFIRQIAMSMDRCPTGQYESLFYYYCIIRSKDLNANELRIKIKNKLAEMKEELFTATVSGNGKQNVHVINKWKNEFKDLLGLASSFKDIYEASEYDPYRGNKGIVLREFLFNVFSFDAVAERLREMINDDLKWINMLGDELDLINRKKGRKNKNIYKEYFIYDEDKMSYSAKKSGIIALLQDMNILIRGAACGKETEESSEDEFYDAECDTVKVSVLF